MRWILSARALVLGVGFSAMMLAGCSDQGDPPTDPNPPAETPEVSLLVPGRTVVGDTIRVEGARFGAQQGASSVLFTSASGGTISGAVIGGGWSDTVVRVVVPPGAADGPVSVRKEDRTGTGREFRVAPALVSYGDDLVPIFQQKGCTSCHGTSSGLAVTPRASLLAGGAHGPAVIPRRSDESLLLRKLGASPPFGGRMPQGGSPLSAEQMQLIADWIDQGARADAVPPPPKPVITELVPARTVVGDTVRVVGSAFGPGGTGSSVDFTAAAGGTVSAEVVPGSWSDTSIRVLVPNGAALGPVVVTREPQTSDGVAFDPAAAVVSYQSDLIPLLEVKGCVSCHGGQSGLVVGSYAELMAGNSDHGPAVRPRRSGQSLIVQVLGNTPPFGIPRMPAGSDALSPAQIRLITDWIDQGARDN